MTKFARYFPVIALITMLPVTLNAQFVNLRLKIEPELSTKVEQDLNFGTLISNSGLTEIQLGDLNVGVFSIRAYHTQNVFMNLSFPSALKSTSTDVTEQIPIDLKINYNNSGENDPLSSYPLQDNQGFISIYENDALGNETQIWRQMYIYVYGTLDIGNVPDGVYTAEVTLSIDYN